LQLAGSIAMSAASAHDKDPHCRFVERGPLHYMIEEAKPIGPPVASPGVECRVRPEFNVAERCIAAITVRPRTKNQPLTAPILQPEIVPSCRKRIRIPPRREMHARCTAVTIMPAGSPDTKLLPELVERAVRPLIEQICLVVRMMPQR